MKNLEFIQFHPTGLWTNTDEKRAFLISEAVRGEGGLLKNKKGVRFMLGQHELNELAPRDIVARAIVREMPAEGDDHVFLDITSQSEEYLSHRFPTIYSECLKRGINIAKDWIPVHPVQHYLIGGIETDLYGRTNVPGLYACGEAAYTGVHGANRLASNSMLECLVFGRRAATDISYSIHRHPANPQSKAPLLEKRPPAYLNFNDVRAEIQQLMNDYASVIRCESGLKLAAGRIKELRTEIGNTFLPSRSYVETMNILMIAGAILEAAILRHESVGAHFREN